MAETLSTTISEHVATVELVERTMRPQFFEELGGVFNDLSANPDVRAIVLHGPEKCFTYGLDLMATFQEHGPILSGANLAGPRLQLRDMVKRWQASISAVESCGAPVIAALNGWCIGGGLDLITACDIRLAAADTKISLRETKIAIVADLGTLQRLPRIVGQGVARELAFTGKDIDAQRAKEIGLVNSIYVDRAATLEAAQAMAREIAANAPLTVRGVKQVLNYSADRSVADGLEYVANWNSAFLGSEDLGEAFAAFAQRREPVFKGK